MRLKIKNKTYTVIECKDDLKPKKNGIWITKFYELKNEAEETKYMIIWSDDEYEILEQPMSATPEMDGILSEIEEIKEPNISSKFNFMVKFRGDKDWQDITENMASCLLRVYYPDNEIPEKIRNIKCGHPLETAGATIETWPKVGEV